MRYVFFYNIRQLFDTFEGDGAFDLKYLSSMIMFMIEKCRRKNLWKKKALL